jgi:hypothetical protein
MAGMPPGPHGTTGAIFWVQSNPERAQVSGQFQGRTPLPVTVNGTQPTTTLVLHIDGRPDCKITFSVQSDSSNQLVVVSGSKTQRLTPGEQAEETDQTPALVCNFRVPTPQRRTR